jgi:EAL domain-containing protein (putative c-di-GMP-specific phosphodiesterase class I)
MDGIPERPQAGAIVDGIVSLAQSLELATVAEGVETDAQLRFLVEHGCTYAQGFLLGRPVPAAAVTALLARGEAAAFAGR